MDDFTDALNKNLDLIETRAAEVVKLARETFTSDGKHRPANLGRLHNTARELVFAASVFANMCDGQLRADMWDAKVRAAGGWRDYFVKKGSD